MAWLELHGRSVTVEVSEELALHIRHRGKGVLWASSDMAKPGAVVAKGAGQEPLRLELGQAGERSVAEFDDGSHVGYRIGLRSFPDADVALELVLALDAAREELLVQVEQSSGAETVQSIEHLYRLEKPVAAGGYLVVPHGSGYLIPADCPDALAGEEIIGHRFSLPLFGMVCGSASLTTGGCCALYVIVESWWDASVGVEHDPGEKSVLDFNWLASLGALRYARRLLLRFVEGMGYVRMAKAYREYARERGLLRTFEEKARQNPKLRRYLERVEFRWPAWEPGLEEVVLADIRRLQSMGIPVNFFFPKWPSRGYCAGEPADSSTGAYSLSEPVPGGWETLRRLCEAASSLGCPVKGFLNPTSRSYIGGEPAGDAGLRPLDAEGQPLAWPGISNYFAGKVVKEVLDTLEKRRLRFDALYFDGYSAHCGYPEDFSPEHPLTRRQALEAEVACFGETWRRGIIPGAELPRFWAVAECAFFFFSDWSSDRLTNVPTQQSVKPVGEPIPLFQLVFHDCYGACFSSGGYALYAPGYDWWPDRNPRLYELLFCSMPANNWLPEGHVPVRDWESDWARRRWDWLRKWSSYYQAIAYSEMTSHEFLPAEGSVQRVTFANGVVAEFDMAAGRLRVVGVPAFTGNWETPDWV